MHFTQLRRSFLGDSVDYEIIMVFDTTVCVCFCYNRQRTRVELAMQH